MDIIFFIIITIYCIAFTAYHWPVKKSSQENFSNKILERIKKDRLKPKFPLFPAMERIDLSKISHHLHNDIIFGVDPARKNTDFSAIIMSRKNIRCNCGYPQTDSYGNLKSSYESRLLCPKHGGDTGLLFSQDKFVIEDNYNPRINPREYAREMLQCPLPPSVPATEFPKIKNASNDDPRFSYHPKYFETREGQDLIDPSGVIYSPKNLQELEAQGLIRRKEQPKTDLIDAMNKGIKNINKRCTCTIQYGIRNLTCSIHGIRRRP